MQLAKAVGYLLKTLVILLGAVATCYLLLLAINWQDEQPSAAALVLQQHLQAPPQLSQDNNGYRYFSDHSADNELSVSALLANLTRQCGGQDCHSALVELQPQLATVIAEHQPMADFYRRLQQFEYWYEPVPATMDVIPSYQPLLQAQQLWLLKAWQAALQQDTAAVQSLLQQDLQFWRRTLASNQLLLGKMVSVSAIKKHFAVASIILQQLPVAVRGTAMPALWSQPFDNIELSLEQALAGEWAFGNMVINTVLQPEAVKTEQSLTDATVLLLLQPLLLPQASSNDRASLLLAQITAETMPARPWYSGLYNPLGKLVNSVAVTDYAVYQQRLQELEPLRQQAVLTTAASVNSTAQ
ncbi:hypothetical protein GCM10009098_13520 [Rheinheimera aquimaris]|uniref:DUF3080 domain-containing protein n=1 Tax=Rheinheimera aquimaris TaxID=412437 RepID=A0ABP3NPK9_9GAMM|nr:hypothetical protein [Rheinheimera aquimaris]MCB5213195.1 hypothetical protein [Rheinheimera aquimaris]